MCFRDEQLLNIFKVSVETLHQIKDLPSDEKYALLEEVSCHITLTCIQSCDLGTEIGSGMHGLRLHRLRLR